MEQQRVLDRYTELAPRYDKVVALWAKIAFFPLNRYRAVAVEELSPEPGDTVLEIGCGTGLNFAHIQDRIGPGGRLIALDYTPAMLGEAERRARERGWRNVTFVQGDAAEVERLVAGPVDGVLSTACLSIVPGWEHAIAGAAALLRPSGRLVVLDFLRMKPAGPAAVFTPLITWWTRHYGFADPGVDYAEVRPWKATLEQHLSAVRYREMYFKTMFLCSGGKAQ